MMGDCAFIVPMFSEAARCPTSNRSSTGTGIFRDCVTATTMPLQQLRRTSISTPAVAAIALARQDASSMVSRSLVPAMRSVCVISGAK